ncbi:MAG: ATP-dependent helicase [Phycisphaerales bacterium]
MPQNQTDLTPSDQPPEPLSTPPGDPAELPEVLRGLTGPQREAVLHEDGPMLVLAAAGSGKTRVITHRIAWLIEQGAPPWSILALTFTNKAAGEMRERVERLLPPSHGVSRGLVVSTFHAFAARLMRRYGESVGLSTDYTIYDTADQRAAIKKVIADLDYSTSNFKPDAVLSSISNAKNKLVGPDEFLANAGDFWDRSIGKIYAGYAKALRDANAVDFDDLLLYTAKLLREDDEVRQELQQRFNHILIDEYQDTNHAQFVIAHTLASRSRNICVVGDPDQSIYGWRGADISNILEFEAHYPEARIVKLGENFRSTAPILRIADHLIKHNRQRHDKPLFTTKEGGNPPIMCACIDEHHEAAIVVRFLQRLSEEHDLPWKAMAVFYRTNALSRVLEGALRDAGIPYTIVRGTAFYQRKEIKDAIAYLRVALNPQDEVSLRRVINNPPRGIGKTTLQKLEVFAIDQGIDFFTALLRVREVTDLNARAIGAVERFAKMARSWRDAGDYMGAEVTGELAEFVSRVINESGLEGHFRKSATDEDLERLENLNELVSSAADFETDYETMAAGPQSFDPFAAPGEAPPDDEPSLMSKLRAYLEFVTLVSDADAVDPESGAVTLMTLHAAKGLEFPAVAIVGLEEGILPHSRARESEAELEEERRLCFVGLTRAQQYLMLTCANTRSFRGIPEATIPSRFLDQLPEDDLEWVGERRPTYADDPWGGGDTGGTREIGSWRRSLTGSTSAPATGPGPGGGGAGGREDNPYPVGCRVRHPQFGVGEVESVTRASQHTRVRIRFQQAGVKTLITQYARLARID